MCRLKIQALLFISLSCKILKTWGFLSSAVSNYWLPRSQYNHYLPKSFAFTDEDEDLYQDEDNFPDFDDNDDYADPFSNLDESTRLLDFAIDSFLRGDYELNFAEDAPAPHPGLTPQTTIEAALHALRNLNDPEPSHGAAVLMRFCVPLSRGERWGSEAPASFKEVLRGALTPTMLARRLRMSEFSCLLDWERLDVTKGAFSVKRDGVIEIGVPSSVAFVNAALYFAKGAPILVQFMLRKINGVWLIDTARLSSEGLFVDNDENE